MARASRGTLLVSIVADLGHLVTILRLGWKEELTCRLPLADMVKILIMSPANQHILQPAPLFIYPAFRLQLFVPRILIVLETLGQHNLVAPLAPHHKRIAHHIPLALCPKETEQLAQIMDQPRHLHPLGLAVPPYGLGSLQEVLDLPDGRVGVGLVDEGVEHLHGFPDRHAGVGRGEEALARGEVEGEGLFGVLFLMISIENITWDRPRESLGGEVIKEDAYVQRRNS